MKATKALKRCEMCHKIDKQTKFRAGNSKLWWWYHPECEEKLTIAASANIYNAFELLRQDML